MGLRAHEYAGVRNLAWAPHAAAFVAQLESWACRRLARLAGFRLLTSIAGLPCRFPACPRMNADA